MVTTTVLIVDDHAAFRQAVRLMLEADGFDVVAEAATGREAIELVRRLEPDVVLLDVQLPDLDGFAVADRIAVTMRAGAIVLISSRDAETYGDRVSRSPARGFLDKSALSGEAVTRVVA